MPSYSPKQIQTRQRNWRIFMLRGLWCQISTRLLSQERCEQTRKLIDEELAELGVETQEDRSKRERAEAFAPWKED